MSMPAVRFGGGITAASIACIVFLYTWFGKPEELVEYFKRHGISEIHYEQDIDKKDWVPKICASQMIIKGAGLLWGIK